MNISIHFHSFNNNIYNHSNCFNSIFKLITFVIMTGEIFENYYSNGNTVNYILFYTIRHIKLLSVLKHIFNKLFIKSIIVLNTFEYG